MKKSKKEDIVYCNECGKKMIWAGEDGGKFNPYSEIYICPDCMTGKRVVNDVEDVEDWVSYLGLD